MKQSSTIFQLSIFSMCCLASLMLATAEEALFPYVLTLPLALAALLLTERWKVFRLSPAWSSLLGTSAFVYAAFRMWPLVLRLLRRQGLPEQGLSVEVVVAGHLLVFLTWVVFFLPKQSREYWSMCTLSVLQVAIGAVLTSAGTYGMLLGGYLCLGIWTLSLFSLEQVRWQFVEAKTKSDVTPATARASTGGSPHSRDTPRTPLDSLTDFRLHPGSVRGSIQLDPNSRWINSRFVLGILGTAIISFAVSACFVILTPRIWANPDSLFGEPHNEKSASLTGFSDTVTLGDESNIQESSDRVLDVKIFDNNTGKQIDVLTYAKKLGMDEPLFRGAVMQTYKNREWISNKGEYSPVNTIISSQEAVRQEIRIHPIDTDILFAIHPVDAVATQYDNVDVWKNRANMLRRGPDSSSGKPLDLIAYSSFPEQRRSLSRRRLRSRFTSPVWRMEQAVDKNIRREHLQFPQTGLSRLREYAIKLASQSRSEGFSTVEEIAQRMEAHLRDSGEFGYTLVLSPQDPNLDPLEDFLFNTKQGHCEFHASALAMMLRAVNIPTRLVSGFKGGTLNTFSGEYEVQQRHAHAWVEYYFNRRWITLDPTPADERSKSVKSMEPKALTWSEFRNLAEGLWSNYVANADLTKQRLHIYTPLTRRVRDWWISIQEGKSTWSELAKSTLRFVTTPADWFSWQGGLFVAGIATIISLLIRALKLIKKRSWRFWRLFSRTQRLRRSQIAFYERFRKICRARGLVRETSQTQREFATLVHQALNEFLSASGLSTFPRQLVDSFYHVRFGSGSLDPQTSRQIDLQLTELETALKNSHRQR